MHIEFEISGLPKTTNGNARTHWTKQKREADKWKRAVNLAVIAFDRENPKISAPPFAKAKLTLTRHSSACPDFDGLVSSFKHVIDGLIEAGVIVSDKISVIGQPEYKWVKAKPKQGKITVKVEEV